MPRRTSLHALLLAAILSCGTDPSGRQTTTLTGVARDYELGGTLGGAAIALLEDPSKTTTADAGGGFSFADLTRGDSVRVIVTGTNYRETIGPIRHLDNGTVNVNAPAASVAFVGSRYAEVGVTPTAGDAMIVVRLEDAQGNPRTGIPLADITLLDQNQAPTGTGPYIFGATGLDNTLVLTTAFSGVSRIAFLNVPPGSYTLRVVLLGGTVLLRPVVARSNGVTLGVR
jgi:hypothetical protein